MNGRGALLLWNDIEPGMEAEYLRWHSREHVPERITVPGILAGRRYRTADPEWQRYLSVYELESTDVLNRPAYLALLANPTPWSRAMRPYFRRVTRSACSQIASAGTGLGACLVAIRIQGDARALARRAVIECAAMEGMIAAHWYVIDTAVPGLAWAPPSNEGQACKQVLLAESTDHDALEASRMRLVSLARDAVPGAAAECSPVYGLMQLVGK